MARTVPGSGASITPVFNSTYGVKDIFVVSGGTGYTAGDPPKLVISNCGTPVRDAVLRPVINTAGEIQSVEIIDPGEGYDPLRLVVESTDAGSFGADADLFLKEDGSIDLIQMRTNGDNYFGGTTARLEGGGGAGAELVPVTGFVTGLSLENQGRNYSRDDVTIVISGGGGEGATGIAEVNEFGKLENITISNEGEFFETPPIIQIIGGGGSGGTAEAQISLGKITDITITNPGGGYSPDPLKAPDIIFTRNTNLIRTTRNRQSLNSVVYNVTGLTKDVAVSDVTINVETTNAFPGSGKALIGKELFRYTSKTATQFKGISRGINFKYDQKVTLDTLQDDPGTGITGYQFTINDRVRRVQENSDNKIAIVYDWRPATRDLYLVFQVDELAFIDAGRSQTEASIVAFVAGVASSTSTGVEPHVLLDSNGDEIILFTEPLTVFPNKKFEDDDELSGAGDGIPDLVNTGTDYEYETSLDGGLASSLYGIEETVGGQNTTLLAIGDSIYDGSQSQLVASVQSAGQLGDGEVHLSTYRISSKTWPVATPFQVNETVSGSTTGVTAVVTAWTPASASGQFSYLDVKTPANNGAEYQFTTAENVVGGTSGASIKPWEITYDSQLRNEPE